MREPGLGSTPLNVGQPLNLPELAAGQRGILLRLGPGVREGGLARLREQRCGVGQLEPDVVDGQGVAGGAGEGLHEAPDERRVAHRHRQALVCRVADDRDPLTVVPRVDPGARRAQVGVGDPVVAGRLGQALRRGCRRRRGRDDTSSPSQRTPALTRTTSGAAEAVPEPVTSTCDPLCPV